MKELLKAYQYIGLKSMLSNMRMFKKAQQPLRGFVTTLCFWTLMDCNFFDEVSREKEVDYIEYAEKNNIDPSILEAVILLFFRLRYFKLKCKKVSWTKKGFSFYNDSLPTFNIFKAYQSQFFNLDPLLRKEVNRSEIVRDDDLVAAGFRVASADFTFRILAKMLSGLGNISGVIELGCGRIDFLYYLFLHNQLKAGLGIDYSSHYLNMADKLIANLGQIDNINLIKADIFEIDQVDYNFDAYQALVAIDLFHGYCYESLDKIRRLFQLFKRTFPNKKLLISELCLADDNIMKNIAYPSVEHELFHELTYQRTFREHELPSLLEEAGFRIEENISFRNLASRQFVICTIIP